MMDNDQKFLFCEDASQQKNAQGFLTKFWIGVCREHIQSGTLGRGSSRKYTLPHGKSPGTFTMEEPKSAPPPPLRTILFTVTFSYNFGAMLDFLLNSILL